jgi:hypothetical protein
MLPSHLSHPSPCCAFHFFVGFTYCAECRHTHCDYSEPREDLIKGDSVDPPQATTPEGVSSISAPLSSSPASTAVANFLLPTSTLQGVEDVPLPTLGRPIAAPKDPKTLGFDAASGLRVPKKRSCAPAAWGRIYLHSKNRQPEAESVSEYEPSTEDEGDDSAGSRRSSKVLVVGSDLTGDVPAGWEPKNRQDTRPSARNCRSRRRSSESSEHRPGVLYFSESRVFLSRNFCMLVPVDPLLSVAALLNCKKPSSNLKNCTCINHCYVGSVTH